jgi:hypothetical protein
MEGLKYNCPSCGVEVVIAAAIPENMWFVQSSGLNSRTPTKLNEQQIIVLIQDGVIAGGANLSDCSELEQNWTSLKDSHFYHYVEEAEQAKLIRKQAKKKKAKKKENQRKTKAAGGKSSVIESVESFKHYIAVLFVIAGFILELLFPYYCIWILGSAGVFFLTYVFCDVFFNLELASETGLGVSVFSIPVLSVIKVVNSYHDWAASAGEDARIQDFFVGDFPERYPILVEMLTDSFNFCWIWLPICLLVYLGLTAITSK